MTKSAHSLNGHSRLHTWFEITRISNTPTVISNVAAGLCLALGHIEMLPLLILSASVICIYTAGMILNDVCDEAVDRRERPERPLPSGRLTRNEALSAMTLLFLSGLVLLANRIEAVGAALALIGLIVVYNWRHKQNPISILVMGACRAMIYVLVAVAVAGAVGQPTRAMAGMLLLYIASVTWLARNEASAHVTPSRLAALGVVWVPLILMGVSYSRPAALCVNIAFLAWVLFSLRDIVLKPGTPPGPSIGKLLAGMCLFDAVIVAATQPWWTPLPIAAMLAVLGLHRRIKGT